jgi:hypothetical protein
MSFTENDRAGRKPLQKAPEKNEDSNFGFEANCQLNKKPPRKSMAAFFFAAAEIVDLGCKNQLLVGDGFRCRLAHFKLCAHFLDLRSLLFELSRQNIHPFLLLSHGGL